MDTKSVDNREMQTRYGGVALVLMLIGGGLLLGQLIKSWRVYNARMESEEQPRVSLWIYLKSGRFAKHLFDNMENQLLRTAFGVVSSAYMRRKTASAPNGREQNAPGDPHRYQQDARSFLGSMRQAG